LPLRAIPWESKLLNISQTAGSHPESFQAAD
jgi:hypothetical protein